jgi:hypothetical protein
VIWRVFFLGLIFLASASCHRPRDPRNHTPAAAYVSWWDRFRIRTGWYVPGFPGPCQRRSHDPKHAFDSVPVDECVKMDAPKRWRGLWRDASDSSQFCAAPAASCPLTIPATQLAFDRATNRKATGAVYAVDLIGRRTSYEGSYGWLGQYDHVIMVDRMISMEPLLADPGSRPG